MNNRWLDFTTHDKRLASRRGVQFSIVTFAFALVPQILSNPGWAAILCLLLSVWRLYVAFVGKEPPHTYLVSFLAALGMLGVFLTYTGVETSVKATIALSILAACRNLQSKLVTQFSSTLLLLPLIPMGYFLQENPDWYIAYSLGFFWLLLTSTLEFWNTPVGTTPLVKRGGLWMLAGLPVLLLCFYFMPRPSGLFKQQQRTPSTGMSNTLKPGSIAKLAKSEGIAFTASMDKPVISSELYWRGAVLRAYDGLAWREDNGGLPAWKVNAVGSQSSYTIVIPDGSNGFRYVLEHASRLNPIEGSPGKYMMYGSGVLTSNPQHFVMYSVLGNTKNELATSPSLLDLAIPANFHKRTNELVETLRSTGSTPEQFIERTRQWVISNKFVYSMEPGVMDGDWMDTFLFERRRGFCEHYASTLTYMLRKAGHPARVVVGYQGADLSSKNSILNIPQAAAHAWVEYWEPRRKLWIRMDPTTWVAPERLTPMGWDETERNLLAHEKDGTWFGKLKFVSVQLSSKWNRWVANYDAEEQRNIFKQLNQGSLKYAYLVGTTLAILFLFWIFRVQHTFYRDPVFAYNRLLRRLEGVGLKTEPGTTPLMVITKAKSLFPANTSQLDSWYAAFSASAYEDRKVQHLGLLTSRLLLNLPYITTHKLKRACLRLAKKLRVL